MRFGTGCGQYVDHAEAGAGEDGSGPVEFLEELGDGVVAGTAGSTENADMADAVRLSGGRPGFGARNFMDGTNANAENMPRRRPNFLQARAVECNR